MVKLSTPTMDMIKKVMMTPKWTHHDMLLMNYDDGDGSDDDNLHPGHVAFISNYKMNYLTKYCPKYDTYRYEQCTDENGKEQDLSNILWSPPKEWSDPVILWNKIWETMDYIRLGYRRNSYYEPPEVINGVEYNALIQFSNRSNL